MAKDMYTGKKPAGNMNWVEAAKTNKQKKAETIKTRQDARSERGVRGVRMGYEHRGYRPIEYRINQREFNKFLGIAHRDKNLEDPYNLEYMLAFRDKAYSIGDQKTIDAIQEQFKVDDTKWDCKTGHPLYQERVDVGDLVSSMVSPDGRRLYLKEHEIKTKDISPRVIRSSTLF